MNLRLTVVIPIHNRTSLLSYPLRSLRQASLADPTLRWELIVVDDGSTEEVAASLAEYPDLPTRLIRLPVNQGLLAARLAGLEQAKGDAVFFLDADDGITPGKFTHQLPVLFDQNADVVTGDVARCELNSEGIPTKNPQLDPPTRTATSPADFFLTIQPAPHDPIFRRTYLQRALAPPLILPSRDYDSIAETWFYYHLAIHPAKIIRVPGAWSVVGSHPGERLSRHWERQCAAALRLMNNFDQLYPRTELGENARRIMSHCAFSTWRALPFDFPAADGFLELWRKGPRSEVMALGGPTFGRLARWFGPVATARVFKQFQRPAYSTVRTVSDEELRQIFA